MLCWQSEPPITTTCHHNCRGNLFAWLQQSTQLIREILVDSRIGSTALVLLFSLVRLAGYRHCLSEGGSAMYHPTAGLCSSSRKVIDLRRPDAVSRSRLFNGALA
jgi:hypothetical protein